MDTWYRMPSTNLVSDDDAASLDGRGRKLDLPKLTGKSFHRWLRRFFNGRLGMHPE